MEFNPQLLCLNINASVQEALKLINSNEHGIVLVVNLDKVFIGTLTDGDFRRAFLEGHTLKTRIEDVLRLKNKGAISTSITAPPSASAKDLLSLMKEKRLRHIPIIDEKGHVVALKTIEDLLIPDPLNCSALILAGGLGTRLRPFTEHTIKPMLPMSGRPLIDLTINHLTENGVDEIFIATYYHSEEVSSYFRSDKKYGAAIHIIKEPAPLGTAGSIGILPDLTRPLIVFNGDILCKPNFREMFSEHKASEAPITVGVKKYEQRVPYGVVKSNKNRITGIVEKPTNEFEINTGIYIINQSVQKMVKKNQAINMTDIIEKSLTEKVPVNRYIINDLWIDIGDLNNYMTAQSSLD
jgi:dTDP-glucose pyrophosphorylase/CBS domain-containing protein